MADFLIVGGGIAGVSVAARLSHLGSVILCEAEGALGYHASGRSAAMLEETYGKPSTIALNRASKGYLATAHGGLLRSRGLLLVGGVDEREEFLRDQAAMAMQPISIDEARAIVPILDPATVGSVAYHDEAWDIDTDRLLQNFAREARANDAAILTAAGVSEIERTGTGWSVQTNRGRQNGRILINAAGAWVDEVAKLAGVAPLGFTPFRRSIACVPAPAGHDILDWPMMFGADESWYAKPDAGRLLVSPADEDPAVPHDAWADDLVLAEGIARYEARVTEPVRRVENSWAGLRTFAPDRELVIGFDRNERSFFWHAGQGGYGMQTSPAASRVAADLISGSLSDVGPETIAALSPLRFG